MIAIVRCYVAIHANDANTHFTYLTMQTENAAAPAAVADNADNTSYTEMLRTLPEAFAFLSTAATRRLAQFTDMSATVAQDAIARADKVRADVAENGVSFSALSELFDAESIAAHAEANAAMTRSRLYATLAGAVEPIAETEAAQFAATMDQAAEDSPLE